MKLLAFSLSLRKGSYNRKLIKRIEQIVQSSKVEIEVVDLKEYEMPAYNADIQEDPGFPEAAERFKKKLESAQGLIIASPEYNFSYPGHFKNTFDWLSRYRPMPWSNKVALFLSASPSLVGGNRGLWQLRVPFEACGTFVYPEMFSLASAHQAFNENDELVDPAAQKRLTDLILSFLRYAEGLQYINF